jgi:hypothetical protein
MRNIKIAISLATWSLSILCGFYLGYHLSTCEEISQAFWLFTITLLPVCFFLPLITPHLPWLCPIFAFAAITLGLGVDAFTDTAMDRNLWGLEAILAQAMAFPGFAIGGIAGVFLSYKIRHRQKKAQQMNPLYRNGRAHFEK